MLCTGSRSYGPPSFQSPLPPHRPEAKELNSELLSETNPRVDLGGGCGCAVHQEKALVPLFLRSLLIPSLITLSLEKEIFVLEKKSGKSLEFWIQKSVQTP